MKTGTGKYQYFFVCVLVLNVKTAFKVVAGGLTIAASLDVLTRACEYEELIQAVSTCVLPAGTNLMSITSGCVCLKVQVENIAALETLWLWYQNGMLKARLQAFFVTDEIRELAGGEQVEVAVTIDEQEYENARKVLVKEAKAKGNHLHHHQKLKQRERQKSNNRFRLAKQQLCTCITLFCTFLCCHCHCMTTT